MTPFLKRLLAARAAHVQNRLALQAVERAVTQHIDKNNRITQQVSKMERDASNRTLGLAD